jgi:hypothetical protein
LVHRTYVGLGPRARAVEAFERLLPFALDLMEMRRSCRFGGLNHKAVGIAIDGLETAAFHFTRRRDFYYHLDAGPEGAQGDNERLDDRDEALAAFRKLTPYAEALRGLQTRCRPFGQDYLALSIALDSLQTAAFHFTREPNLYASRSDFGGPIS